MHKAVLTLCACAVLAGSLQGSPVKDSMTALRAVALANHNFTSALYEKLSHNEGNIFFSPLSIQMILALASMGAQGNTQQQMIEGLFLPQSPQLTKEGFLKLALNLKRNDEVVVKIANKILADKDFELKEEFISTAETYFHAEASKADFKNDPEGARQKVNRWVEDMTNDKIKDLFVEGSINHDTVMVLANAVYFKANWAIQFNKENTTMKPFHLSETETKDVPMMYAKNEFFYKRCKDLDAQILEIPYVDHKLSLVVILPNERNNLAEVERRLATMPLSAVTKHLRLMDTHLWLPTFKMEHTLDLKPILKEMGMTDMFLDTANFTGIADGGVFVDQVAHKAFIEVNEEGSEAAAASGVIAMFISLPPPPKPPVTFNANHPFIFMLRNRVGAHEYGHGGPSSILFMGRYTKPSI